MGLMQAVILDKEAGSFGIAWPAPNLTRDEKVRMEGAHAAHCGYSRHDNPYRTQSADGVSWRVGFDSVASA